MKINKVVWTETQDLILGGIYYLTIGIYLITSFIIGIPLYIIVGVLKKINPSLNIKGVSREGGGLDWKTLLFGNPFKKSPSNKGSSEVVKNSDYFGVPSENKKVSNEKDLSTKIFDSRQEAGTFIEERLRKAYYQDIFYTITIRCPNCRIEGVVRLTRGEPADNAECPRCEVEGLQVIGVGSNRDVDVINSPRLDEDTEKEIEGQVSDAVEHAWSIGRIKRGGIFE
jgi:hypothetical protein